MLFDFAAPDLDITYLISQIDPELLGDFYANLVAEGKIALSKGKIKNFEFNDVKNQRDDRSPGLAADEFDR